MFSRRKNKKQSSNSALNLVFGKSSAHHYLKPFREFVIGHVTILVCVTAIYLIHTAISMTLA